MGGAGRAGGFSSLGTIGRLVCGHSPELIDYTLSRTRVRNERLLRLVYRGVQEPITGLELVHQGRTKIPLAGRFFLAEIRGVAGNGLPVVELTG